MLYFISALIFYAVVTTLIFSIEKRIQEISKKLDEVYDEVRYAYLQLRLEKGGGKSATRKRSVQRQSRKLVGIFEK